MNDANKTNLEIYRLVFTHRMVETNGKEDAKTVDIEPPKAATIATAQAFSDTKKAMAICQLISWMKAALLDGLETDFTDEYPSGHWEEMSFNHGGITEKWYKCSCCGYSSALNIPRNFCPKCGMKEVKGFVKGDKE